jgi:hypothetical protein
LDRKSQTVTHVPLINKISALTALMFLLLAA